jgi:hypothetical protein
MTRQELGYILESEGKRSNDILDYPLKDQIYFDTFAILKDGRGAGGAEGDLFEGNPGPLAFRNHVCARRHLERSGELLRHRQCGHFGLHTTYHYSMHRHAT